MPKVIDLPTATSMDNSDYLLMEESTGGTKKITKSNFEAPSSSTITPASGVTVVQNKNYVYKAGRVVQFVYWVSGVSLTSNSWTVIGTLPAGFRPIADFYTLLLDYGENPCATVNVAQNGNIRVYGSSWSSSAFRLTATYISES